jgi:hypothetical protein
MCIAFCCKIFFLAVFLSNGFKCPVKKKININNVGMLEGKQFSFRIWECNYHETNESSYKKWLRDKMIPTLPPNLRLVVDSASYHCVQNKNLLLKIHYIQKCRSGSPWQIFATTKKCWGLNYTSYLSHTSQNTRVYPKVSALAAWSENSKWYSCLPLGVVVSLFCESV